MKPGRPRPAGPDIQRDLLEPPDPDPPERPEPLLPLDPPRLELVWFSLRRPSVSGFLTSPRPSPRVLGIFYLLMNAEFFCDHLTNVELVGCERSLQHLLVSMLLRRNGAHAATFDKLRI